MSVLIQTRLSQRANLPLFSGVCVIPPKFLLIIYLSLLFEDLGHLLL